MHGVVGGKASRRPRSATASVYHGTVEAPAPAGGEDMEFGPGDLMICPPGHDAWILGDEPCVVIDWTGVADYAKR